MRKKEWRIFISYRGKTVGKSSTEAFGERLYGYLTDDPLCKEKYGEVYFSPKTGQGGDNYKHDIPDIMQSVQYFVMPLNEAYFADFLDEEKNYCPDEESITYKEIRAAMKNEGCRFICITMPDYKKDQRLLHDLFSDNASIISCSVTLSYDPLKETELFRKIGDVLVREDFGTASMSDILQKDTPNVFMSFKGQLEAASRYPFYHRLHDVKKITLLNFASSVFISGIQIASIYEEGDYLKRFFNYHLANGNIEVDIILTDPHCIAARDAALYKMYPSGQKVPTDQIILTNINKLYRFIQENPDARINLYLTDIALPYGLMITEHVNPANNHMKVDLYAAAIEDDQRRPSFYLLQSDPKTAELYSFFVSNAQNILRNHAYPWHGHPDMSWIRGKNIIHRAVIGPGFLPHTKRSVEACLSAGFPMEIDLLELKDGKIVIGRADQAIAEYGVKDRLEDCTAVDIRKINKKAGEDKILFLSEFLDLVGGRVPLLLEIKLREWGEPGVRTREFVQRVMAELERYLDQFIPRRESPWDHSCHVAIHSSNPYALKLIRQIDCMIPVGMISMDFSRIADELENGFLQAHTNESYLDIIHPDFLSYNIQDIENSNALRICRREQIPLLAWTIRNEDEQQEALDYGCDNIIIEGAKSFL